jgi:DNA-directed RNA polymerase specialized sigma24 family protein
MPYESHWPDPGRLRRAIARLPAIERDILFLTAREGLPFDVVAVRLDLPPETVRRRLADALCRLDRLQARPKRRWWWFR